MCPIGPAPWLPRGYTRRRESSSPEVQGSARLIAPWCPLRHTLRLMAEEDAFRRAVEAHRVVSDEREYEAVWSLLEPLATSAPAGAVQIGLVGLGSADAAERSVATDLLGLVAGLHRSYRSQVVRRLLRHSKTEHYEDVQWSLAMASAHSGDARTFPVLARLTESSDPDVRYQGRPGSWCRRRLGHQGHGCQAVTPACSRRRGGCPGEGYGDAAHPQPTSRVGPSA